MESQRRGTIAAESIGLCWESLQKKHKDIPKAVVVVLPYFERRWLGLFDAAHWIEKGRYNISELGISSRLFNSPRDALSVILHEAAHAILWNRGIISVTGDGGYYHIKEFRNVCRDELFLECVFRNTRYGWHDTCLSKNSERTHYQEEIEILKKLPKGTGRYKGPKIRGKDLPETGYIYLSCKCKRSIRCTPRVYVLGGIICASCGTRFTPCSPPKRRIIILDYE